jgi:hypothetical protein
VALSLAESVELFCNGDLVYFVRRRSIRGLTGYVWANTWRIIPPTGALFGKPDYLGVEEGILLLIEASRYEIGSERT